MATQYSIEVAAQCWCEPTTSSKTMDPALAMAFAERLDKELQWFRDAVETAMGIIANAGGGHWERETAEWREAAERWRDNEWHKVDSSVYEARKNDG
jgi:hypothetical protein